MVSDRFSLYTLLQNIWHLIPRRVRSALPFVTLRELVGSRFRQYQQGIYSARFFNADVESPAIKSSSCIADSVCRYFDANRVVDVGCGSGALLAAFGGKGKEILGLEYSDAGCAMARQKGIPVHAFDVRHDAVNPEWGRFDVVLCTEVAEHIPGKYETKLVQVLTSLGDTIIFTAALPGQGGTGHVNEQPRSYWVDKFRSQGCDYNETLTATMSDNWRRGGAESWYWKNLFVFSRIRDTGTKEQD